MKRRDCLKLIIVFLLLSPAVSAQSRAYVKFGPAGETIGIFGLIKDAALCKGGQLYAGTIASVRTERLDSELEYRFTFEKVGKRRIFSFVLGVDEIPRSDIENLITKKRGVRVRACQGDGIWVAEEIIRM